MKQISQLPDEFVSDLSLAHIKMIYKLMKMEADYFELLSKISKARASHYWKKNRYTSKNMDKISVKGFYQLLSQEKELNVKFRDFLQICKDKIPGLENILFQYSTQVLNQKPIQILGENITRRYARPKKTKSKL